MRRPAGTLDARATPDGSSAPELPDTLEISREELGRRLSDPSLVLLDVLPAESYRSEHIPRSISLPLVELPGRASEFLPDRGAELAVYCAAPT